MAIAAPSSSSLGSTSAHASSLNGFDIVSSYHGHLSSDPELPMPIASVLALADLIAHSRAATTSELMESIRAASIHLKKSLSNPVPATAGLDLFTRFVITKNWEGDVSALSTRSFPASSPHSRSRCLVLSILSKNRRTFKLTKIA